MVIKNKKILSYTMVVLLFLSMVIVAKEAASLVMAEYLGQDRSRLVVIDAGHGAADSGKVGINGELEKDINLVIAMKLKELLEQQDVEVIMTREDDKGFYPQTGSNRKIRDMEKRVELINSKQPALVISVHQNSYPDASVSGPQTFYYEGSEEGQFAAQLLQNQLITTLQPPKERVAKSNTSYYMLKHTNFPIVIVECGFLTNAEEAKLLGDEAYQQKMAWAIHLGVLQYLNHKGEIPNEMDTNSN